MVACNHIYFYSAYPKVFVLTIFVSTPEFEQTRDRVIKRLTDSAQDCDLVIIQIHDIISAPPAGIAKYSVEAYQVFLTEIEQYFEFR